MTVSRASLRPYSLSFDWSSVSLTSTFQAVWL